MKVLFYSIFILLLTTGTAGASQLQLALLPDDLLARAVSAQISYDEDFDYVKLGQISRLRLGKSHHSHTASSPRKTARVDHVVVNKRRHQMLLLKNGKVIKTFKIALSDRPKGHKRYEGDRRTPEGTYTLDYIKTRSNYYKAFHISYPNFKDTADALRRGRRPGGMIMVHGQPSSPEKARLLKVNSRRDWTSGCIALHNNEMDLFLSLVDVGTPITINP